MTEKISILAPNLSGGKTDRAYLIGKVLQKLGYEVKVLGFLFEENINPQPPFSLPITYIRGNQYPAMFKSSLNFLKEINGDIIYAMKPLPTTFGIALLKRLRKKKPLILDIDDWELNAYGDNWRYKFNFPSLMSDIFSHEGGLKNPEHPLYIQWSEKLIDKANGITISNRFLENRYGGTYLPTVQDIDLFDPEKYDSQANRQSYGLNNYRMLMFFGKVKPYHGLEDVLSALKIINESDLKLVLVGSEQNNDSYLQNIVKKWGKWILIIPQPLPETIPEIISLAHIMIIPQREGEKGIAEFLHQLINGMAMAKPIIATRVGDIPEVLKDTGFFVKSKSPQEIAQAIQLIFNNWENAIIKGKEARQRCVNNYSLDNMASILSKVIKLAKRSFY